MSKYLKTLRIIEGGKAPKGDQKLDSAEISAVRFTRRGRKFTVEGAGRKWRADII